MNKPVAWLLGPVGEMAEAQGEIARLAASITGEMKVEDIPLAAGVDLAALKAGDTDPLEVVVEVPAGRSKRGWNYMPSALQKIVGEVATKTASGFLGHQDPEKVDHEFLAPVTHWVGAKFENGKAYFRGVVDSAAKDLKRWIRAGRVKQVSIFGVPTLAQANGETQVVDYQLLSIDWTPLDRAGMPTKIVAVGEIDVIGQGGDALASSNGGGEMNLKELLAKLKELGAGAKQVCGEMGWDFAALAKELGGEAFTGLEVAAKAVGEIADVFGIKDAKPADLVARVKVAHEAETKLATADHDKLVDKVVGEMVVAEVARPIVKRMLQVPGNADEAAIKKAVGEMLGQEDVKKALAGVFKDTLIAPKDPTRDGNKGDTGLRVRRAAI
ncbi:MAG: hypothetical protein WD024_06855 [Bacillota bacterium]